jgi:hypothetical protein
MLVAQKDTITKITGVITPESINTLENKLGGAFTILKSSHFNKGQQYGFLAMVIPQAKYRIVINNPTWVYAAPGNPGVYAAVALGANVNAAQPEQIVACHKEEQTSYTDYLSAQEAGKELLLYGVGDDALAPLKKKNINFGDATIHSMILHLQEKTAIKMTMSQKFEYKPEGYAKQWDTTTSITAYFTGLDKVRTSLANRGISTSIDKMTIAAGARMWESEMFTEDQMVAWENKPAAQQTWQALQDYFTEKWLERRQYSQAMAKHLCFKDAALAAQEMATAEGDGETTVMMFALLQEQHRSQMETLAAANQQTMDAMLEQMNAIIAGQGKALDKENVRPPNTNATTGTDGKSRKKTKCPHCKKYVFHSAADCYELEANANKRWTGWKLVKEAALPTA